MRILLAAGVLATLVAAAASGATFLAQADGGGDRADRSGGPDAPPMTSQDLLDSIEPGTIRLVAIQAVEAANVTFAFESKLSGPSSAWHCAVTFAWGRYPVDLMLAQARGEDPPQPTQLPATGMGMGAGGSSPDFRVGDVQFPTPGMGWFSSRSTVGGEVALDAGEWLLVGYGVAGVDMRKLEGDSFVRLDHGSLGEVRVVDLPAAPLACGHGFDQVPSEVHYNLPVLGYHQERGHLAFPTVYGTCFMLDDGLSAGRGGSGKASVTVGGVEHDISTAMTAHHSHFGRDAAALDVESWDGEGGPRWILAGVWNPMEPGPPETGDE